jgi:hypothetical protein
MNPAYTSSTQGGRALSSSSRLQGQGHIDYNVPRARVSRTPGTSRTCASSTHKKTPGDSWIPGGLEDLLSSSQYEGYLPQDSGCTFPYEHKEATVMNSTSINRLLVTNFTEATATFISSRLRVLTEDSAPSSIFMNRSPLRPWMVTRDGSHIYPNKIDPFDQFTPGLLEELA